MELTPQAAEDLIHKGFEAPELDYKVSFDNSTRAWMELAKDVYGMANSGGGFIVIGVEDGTFSPLGVDLSFHKDGNEWSERVSKWATGRIEISYIEYVRDVEGQRRKFPILKINGSVGTFVIPKNDGSYPLGSGAQETAFRQGVVYVRRNSSTVPALADDYSACFWALQRRTIESTGGAITPVETIKALCRKADPDAVTETLWFNLFPVTEIPDFIYVLETAFRAPLDVYDFLRNKADTQKADIPSFMLEDKKIYTLSQIDSTNPLLLCADENLKTIFGKSELASVTKIPIKDWLDDEKGRQKLVKLLNFALKDLCWRRGFSYDRRKDRYYRVYNHGPIPQVTWKPYKKTTTRNLVYLRMNSDTGVMSYCEHFAGRLRFTVLGSGIYLVIEPLRVLTSDGKNPLDNNRNVKIITKKNFYYHNNNYLYDMKLWLHLLAGNRKEIILEQATQKIVVDINPLSSEVDFGILDDQYTNEDFLDSLKSEPFEYEFDYADDDGSNPLTESSLEE